MWGNEGGDSLIKVGTDVRARALGILGINFCPGSRFWEINFARALGFLAIFDKKCVIFDKSEKSDLNLKNKFQFGTLKFMKTSRSLGFWALFRRALGFFGEVLPSLANLHSLHIHTYLC